MTFDGTVRQQKDHLPGAEANACVAPCGADIIPTHFLAPLAMQNYFPVELEMELPFSVDKEHLNAPVSLS